MPFDPDKYLAAKPASERFDPDAYLAVGPRDLAGGPRDLAQTIGHKLGVGTRAVVEGLAEVPGMVYDAAAVPFNVAIAGYNALTGSERPQIAPARQQVSGALDIVGLPQPKTPGERMVSAVNRGAASMLPGIAVGTAANIPALASTPVPQIASGAGGAAASQGAKEMGYGPVGQAVSGLTGALAAPAFTSGVSGLLSPKVREGAAELVEKGVTPTYGQMRGGSAEASENLAARLPIVGPKIKEADQRTVQQFATAAVNDALAPIGARVRDGQTGNKAVAEAHKILKDAYDDVLGQIKVQPQAVAEVLPKVRAATAALGPDEEKLVVDLVQQIFGNVRSAIGGQDLNKARRAFENAAYDAQTQPLKDAYSGLASAVTDLMKRAAPGAVKELSAVDAAWSNFVRVRNAATREAARGTFNPAQLAQASRQLDVSAGKTAYAEGRAPMQQLAQTGIDVFGKNPVARGEPPLSLFQAFAHPVMLSGSILRYPLYTETGQNLAARALTQRPEYLRALAEALRYPTMPQIGLAASEASAR